MKNATETFFGGQRAVKRECEELRNRIRAETLKATTVAQVRVLHTGGLNMFDTETFFRVSHGA